MRIPGRKPKGKGKKAKPIPYRGCWACSMNKCHLAVKDNTCTCCRNNHSGVR